MNLLFWNMNGRKLAEELGQLVLAYDLDILILAECSVSPVDILEAVNTGSGPTFTMPFNPSSKIEFYTRLPDGALFPISDAGGVSVRKLTPPLGPDVILVAVHLPSKLHHSDSDLAMFSIRVAEVIEEAERRTGHDRTVVIGDFNMNPFEKGMVAADAMHAVMDRRTASELERTVQKRQCRFFFNPMWSRLGDGTAGPPGTYYYRSSSQACYFWNTFDQVLIRPSLLDFFCNDDLKVVTTIGQVDLLDRNGRPDQRSFSDHLPLYVKLETERATTHGD